MSEDYLLLPSGATAFKFDDPADKVTVTAGSAINGLTNITLEFVIYYTPSSSLQILASKNAGYWQMASINPDGTIYIYRTTSGTADEWTTTDALTSGNWYDIQITWACGSGPGATPTFTVNDVAWGTPTHTSVGTGTWAADTGDLLVGHLFPADTTVTFSGIITVFRLHSRILTSVERHTNYITDSWRYYVKRETAPNVIISAKEPAVGIGWTQTTIPNVTVAPHSPTVVPLLWNSCPGVVTDALAPAVATSSNIVQVKVPNTTTRAHKPIVCTHGDYIGYVNPLPINTNLRPCRQR